MARAKFRCSSVEQFTGDSQKVNLNAVSSAKKEDQEFNQATPWGELKMQIDNPALKDFFQPGKEYYLDIITAEA